MNHTLKKFSFILLSCISLHASAQLGTANYKAIDEYVQKLGNLDTFNMGTIAAIVTRPFTDKKERARAIFDWIAFNISFDPKAARSGNSQKNSSTEVLQNRKAVGIGFASLFQDMCSAVDVRCLVPDGFVKNNVEQIGDSKTDINHSWAVVQLGQSPEEWFYVDPAWGSGYCDADMKVFTHSFNDAFFFADKTIFNLQHYPDNEAWKLGPAPKTKSDFYALPLVKDAAYTLKLNGFSPREGHIKAKAGKGVSFEFRLDPGATVSKLSLLKGDHKKAREEDIPFSFDKGLLKCSLKFEEGSSFPVTVRVNGKDLLTYMVDVD